MSTELAGIHPTRLELVRLRRRRVLADGIIDILNKDLDTGEAEAIVLAIELNPNVAKVEDAADPRRHG